MCSRVSSVADSDESSEVGRAIPLFKAAVLEVPQIDSIYVAYDNGGWLQMRPLYHLNDEQRTTLRVPAGAAYGISLIRPTPTGALPMRRVFEDQQGELSAPFGAQQGVTRCPVCATGELGENILAS